MGNIDADTRRTQVTWNHLDMSPVLRLANQDLTISHTCEAVVTPEWGMVRATEAPWVVRRTRLPPVAATIAEHESQVPFVRVWCGGRGDM